MANPAENTLSEVLAAYAFAGEVVGAARFGQGHINDAFATAELSRRLYCRFTGLARCL